LNSPETPLFEKGRELYGLFQAQKTIRAEQKVLVVEGYMDVVALAQLGVEYAVATLGTATTPYHIQKLLRITEHIVFSFDGDKAGQKAAWRALENALPHLQDGKKISFLFLPAEHDPDSFIRESGKAEFEKRVNEAMPLSAYLLREISADLDLRNPEGRNQLLQRAKPLLTAITAPTAALLLRKEVAALAGVSQAELEGLYEVKPVARTVRPVMNKASRTHISPQRTLLRCLIAQPSLAAQLKEAWYGEGLEAEAIAALLPVLRDSDFEMSSAALMQYFQGSAYEKLLAAEQVGVLEWGETFEVGNYFLDALKKLQTNQEPQQRQEFENRLANKSVQEMSAAEREEYMRLLRRV
jgi:DNA primase